VTEGPRFWVGGRSNKTGAKAASSPSLLPVPPHQAPPPPHRGPSGPTPPRYGLGASYNRLFIEENAKKTHHDGGGGAHRDVPLPREDVEWGVGTTRWR